MLVTSGLFICRWFGLTEVNLCPWLESLTPWAGLVLHTTWLCFHCLHPIIISSLILFVCFRWLQMSGKWWRRRSEALKDLKSKFSFDQNKQADDGLDPPPDDVIPVKSEFYFIFCSDCRHSLRNRKCYCFPHFLWSLQYVVFRLQPLNDVESKWLLSSFMLFGLTLGVKTLLEHVTVRTWWTDHMIW